MPSPALITGTSICVRHQLWRSGIGVADHDRVRAHRAHGVSGIEQRLAFLNAGTGGLNQNGVRSHCLGRDLERTARARRSFIEKKQNPLAFKQGTRPVRVHAPREFQNFQDFRCFKMLDPEQGTTSCIHGHGRNHLLRSAWSRTKPRGPEATAVQNWSQKSVLGRARLPRLPRNANFGTKREGHDLTLRRKPCFVSGHRFSDAVSRPFRAAVPISTFFAASSVVSLSY